jgi:hypothetical protein
MTPRSHIGRKSATLFLTCLYLSCAPAAGTRDSERAGPLQLPTRPETSRCAEGIFSPADDATIDVRKDPALIRQRAVRVDFARLETMPSEVSLNLFDDVCLVATRDETGAGQPGGEVWTGTIRGVPQSNVTLVLTSRTLIGTVISPPRAFQVRLLRDDVHLVNQVDPSKYPKEKEPR